MDEIIEYKISPVLTSVIQNGWKYNEGFKTQDVISGIKKLLIEKELYEYIPLLINNDKTLLNYLDFSVIKSKLDSNLFLLDLDCKLKIEND